MFTRKRTESDSALDSSETLLTSDDVGAVPEAGGGGASEAEPSVISRGVVLKGTITAPGPLHFQGSIEGEVEAPQVSLGNHGTIKGKVKCRDFSLDGFVDGEVVCKQLTAGASARLKGVVECESIELELGASINGEVRVGRG